MTDLLFDAAERVATITLDRPDALNALTVGLREELLAALVQIAFDSAIGAVVLTGAGRAFCAGQDLRERMQPGAAPLDEEIRERYNPIILA
ncbi:MAG TPA: enoyl-CoA hydratase-related protein, partial [Candidatus Limnocylindrales bacterium]